jgi:PHD/YefM family antitoxin component YafN of YafNO toxin-antitoxin module
MFSVSVNEASCDLPHLIHESVISHQPITIKGNEHNAVLLSEQDWQAIQETLYLLSIPNMRESISEGVATALSDCEKCLDLPAEKATIVIDFIKSRLNNEKPSSLYQAFDEAGLIGCIETDEQLATTYKEKLDFSIKHGTAL